MKKLVHSLLLVLMLVPVAQLGAQKPASAQKSQKNGKSASAESYKKLFLGVAAIVTLGFASMKLNDFLKRSSACSLRGMHDCPENGGQVGRHMWTSQGPQFLLKGDNE